MFTEQMTVQVEIDDEKVYVVFPRKMDHFMCPWQDARQLGDLILKASNQVPRRAMVCNPVETRRQCNQVKIATHKEKMIVLVFDHTDRISFIPEAAVIVGMAIKMRAHDLELLDQEGVRIRYNRYGVAVPDWEYQRKSFPVH